MKNRVSTKAARSRFRSAIHDAASIATLDVSRVELWFLLECADYTEQCGDVVNSLLAKLGRTPSALSPWENVLILREAVQDLLARTDTARLEFDRLESKIALLK